MRFALDKDEEFENGWTLNEAYQIWSETDKEAIENGWRRVSFTEWIDNLIFIKTNGTN